MPSLTSYRHLIDLTSNEHEQTTELTERDALVYLFTEAQDVSREVATHHLSHIPVERHAELLRTLLTVRDPTQGPLPGDVVEAIEGALRRTSSNSVHLLVQMDELKAVGQELFPEVERRDIPAGLEKISFWRGDITRLASPSLAIVNPANTRMLGCFQPSHLCADNVIHGAAGPRLRQDCYTIMDALGLDDVEVAEPLVTKGHALPAGFVLHVAGPQLERGAAPTEEEKDQLAKSYEGCLDLAAELGTIDTVAFPCISTGLFAYPADQAAQVALSTSLGWLASNPSTPIQHIIFVLFSASDVSHYLAALTALFPSLPPPLPLPKPSALPQKVRDWIAEADSIIVHAGAGLSADAVREDIGIGLNYNSKELFKKLYPGLVESTPLRSLYHTIGYEFEDPLVKWAFILAHVRRILTWGPTPVYKDLLQLCTTRLSSTPSTPSPYSILTSNADQLFLQSDFHPSSISNPQGSYSHFQCLTPCSPTSYFPSLPWAERAAPHLTPQTMRLPRSLASSLIPRCPNCDGEVFLNVRGGEWFLPTPQAGQSAAYAARLDSQLASARSMGRKVVLLELGAGFNTPSVVRFPSERICREMKGEVRLVRVNLGHPEVEGGLREKGWAEGVRMGSGEFLREVLGS